MGNGANDVTHRKRAQDLGNLEKVSQGETVGFRLLAETFVAGATRVGGADEKARIERMCISLPYVETFNSKVIKGFVPELRSCYVFFEFRDSYVLSLWKINVRFTHGRIGLWYTSSMSWICLCNQEQDFSTCLEFVDWPFSFGVGEIMCNHVENIVFYQRNVAFVPLINFNESYILIDRTAVPKILSILEVFSIRFKPKCLSI